MVGVFSDFREAQTLGSGPLLASTISPIAINNDPNRLRSFYQSSNHFSVSNDIKTQIFNPPGAGYRLSKGEGNAWVEVYVAFWKTVGELLLLEDTVKQGSSIPAGWSRVYDSWKDVINALIRGYTGSNGFEAWTVPCLYEAGKYARLFAIKADEQALAEKGSVTFNSGFQDDVVGDLGSHEKLEDAARTINRIFTLCVSDRAPIEESRKWGLYYITNLLFKTYFKLNSIALSKNILRALRASTTDMPELNAFPKSHIVTFRYYVGVLHFLDEDYVKAEENLTEAWRLCQKSATKNRQLIMTYLVPCHLITTHTLPSEALLAPFPILQRLFRPLGVSIKKADLAAFDAALAAGEEAFVKRRIYLTLERGRDIALRNLFRKVFINGGFEHPKAGQSEPTRRTRIPVSEFTAAVKLSTKAAPGEQMENDEVECLIANMIYKNLIKGYISRERGMVVLSGKGNAFPGTGV